VHQILIKPHATSIFLFDRIFTPRVRSTNVKISIPPTVRHYGRKRGSPDKRRKGQGRSHDSRRASTIADAPLVASSTAPHEGWERTARHGRLPGIFVAPVQASTTTRRPDAGRCRRPGRDPTDGTAGGCSLLAERTVRRTRAPA